MTIEEAIKALTEDRDAILQYLPDAKLDEYNMAIAGFEAWQKVLSDLEVENDPDFDENYVDGIQYAIAVVSRRMKEIEHDY